MSLELRPKYLNNNNNWFFSKNKTKEKESKNINHTLNKKCFFEKNLKFINDFKQEFIHGKISVNLYHLIIDICSYVNNKKNYSYNYIIYDINSFFDLYNKNMSQVDDEYLLQFINKIKLNFCLSKNLIDRINKSVNLVKPNNVSEDYESDSYDFDFNFDNNCRINNNINSPEFEESNFNFANNYFKTNSEFEDNLEIEDVEYNNCLSENEY